MPHPPLVASPPAPPHPSPYLSLVFSIAPPSHLWPVFWHLSMIFLHLSTVFRHLSKAVRLLCARYPSRPVTCRCAVHLWPRYSASTSEYCIDKTGGGRACDSTRAGGAALLWWGMALFREVARNRAQIRAHIRARMRAQAPAASMTATKNRLATLTVVRRHLPSLLGGHGEQWVLLAVAVVKRKL